MLKLFTLFIVFIVTVNTSNAAFNESKEDKKETFQAASPAFESAIAGLFTNMSRKECEQLTGRHLSLLERIAFKMAQKQANKNFKGEKQTKGFNPIGFFASFFLGLIGLYLGLLLGLGLLFGLLLSMTGVAGTYAFSKDRNMQKWAWIGVGAYLFAILVIVIIVLSTGYLS